jgi:hypothetical protein
MNEWWRDEKTELCQFFIPTGNGNHVLTLHGREDIAGNWNYAIVQWWHKSPTLWLEFDRGEVLSSHETIGCMISNDLHSSS